MKYFIISLLLITIFYSSGFAQKNVKVYNVYELSFQGENYKITDSPVRDVTLRTTWQHESGSPTIQVYGFYDGNGNGNPAGNVFKVRFCPVKEGVWRLIKVQSNDAKLQRQNEGKQIKAVESDLNGFWEADKQSQGARWYKRSNGTHPYIMGNTMYTFLSETFKGKSTGGHIKTDVEKNAQYFNKIRFSLTGDIYPNPTEKPFLNEQGNPTDDGNYSHRPNSKWFYERADLAVQTCFDNDMIADLILNGPDSEKGRSLLAAGKNNGDYTPWLRYIAARYGSYPNVWICLSNEYNIKKPRFTPEEIKEMGNVMRKFLPYPTPMSVHANSGDWNKKLNGNWCDHIIVQQKLKDLKKAAETNQRNYLIGGGKPVINDELAYEGKGDGWSENDVIEALLGAFAGGGYGSTGFKPASKAGHYFAGNFSAKEHTSADNLEWFRHKIDENINFWKMQPVKCEVSSEKDENKCGIFNNVDSHFCSMEWKGKEYILATDRKKDGMMVKLPEGKFSITLYDLINKKVKHLEKAASGKVVFNTPDSRACLIHVKKVRK